jgi:thiamine pyrophosphokinase
MTHNKNKTVLFANGDLPHPKHLRAQLNNNDFFIAVDGGLSYITEMKLKPNLIIGDLDSADPELVDHFKAQGVEVRKYPPKKNETDLELALDAALEMKPDIIWIAGALGNRLDQTLGNVFLLTQDKLADVDVRIVDGTRQVFIIRKSAVIHGSPGQRLSLIPLNGPATGIITKGLKYPLEKETLYPDQSRGISNRLTGSTVTITIQDGLLLCIHQTNQPTERSG